MASNFPHFYSDLLYPNNFSDVQTLLMAAAGDDSTGGMPAAGEPPFINPPFERTAVSPDALSPLLTIPYPDLYGPFSDMAVPSLPADYNNNNNNNMGNLYNIHSLIGSQPPVVVPGACDLYGEELFGFVPDVKPTLYRDTWGSAQNNYDQMQGVEETNIKVASRYSEEERKERIVRYLKKRNQRNFNKTIKYACRKTLADRRTRVRGRFARNNNEQLCDSTDDQFPSLKTNQLMTPSTQTLIIKQRDQIMMIKNKEEEEEQERWLQELAASNLMYLPNYVTNYSELGV